MSFQQTVKKWQYPLLILIGAVGVFLFLKSTKPIQPPVELKQKSWPVQATRLQLQTLAPFYTLYGKIESTQMVTITAPVAGVVGQLPLKSGDVFEPDQLMVAMAASDLAIPVAIAQADVADIEQQIQLESLAYENNVKRLAFEQRLLGLNENELDRNQQLLKKDLASQAALDQSKAVLIRQEQVVAGAALNVEEHNVKLAQLQARLEKAKANLRQKKVNQARGRLKADFKGRVADVMVAEGSHVSQGASLLRFYPLSSLELRAKLPGSQLQSIYHQLQSGQLMFAEFEMQGEIHQLPLKRLAGESETSGVDAFFALPKALGGLRPGDLMQVQFYQAPIKDVFAVPLSAVYGQNRVYVIEQGHLQGRQVKLLGETLMAGKMVALLQGDLREGELLLMTHLPNAMSGLNVTVME